MAKKSYVLNNVAASAADISLSGGILTIVLDDNGTKLVTDYQLIKRPANTKKVSVAETLQVSTVTYTYAANTVYAFTVSQDIDGKTLSRTISIDTSNPGLGTDALVAAAIVKKFNLLGFKITASGAASPVTLTAITGYAKFTIVGLSNVTVATGTAGVYAVNTYADLVARGITGGVAGNVYTSYEFECGAYSGNGFGGTEKHLDYNTVEWLINEGDSDAATLITRVDRTINGMDSAGTGINADIASLT